MTTAPDPIRFKVLTADGCSAHGGDFTWSLPMDGHPGDWTPRIDHPVMCRRGYHLTTDPMRWPLTGMRVFEAEHDGVVDTEFDKTVHHQVRLIRERPDMIPGYWRDVERFIVDTLSVVPWLQQTGEVNPAWHHSTGPTWSAAKDAARVAALDVARGFTWPAAWEAAWDAARVAASNADRGTAYAAARDAVWDAAWDDVWDAATKANLSAASEAASDAASEAALHVLMEVFCADLDIADQHRQYVRDRWAVWQAGYAVYADVAGRLYTYGLSESP